MCKIHTLSWEAKYWWNECLSPSLASDNPVLLSRTSVFKVFSLWQSKTICKNCTPSKNTFKSHKSTEFRSVTFPSPGQLSECCCWRKTLKKTICWPTGPFIKTQQGTKTALTFPRKNPFDNTKHVLEESEERRKYLNITIIFEWTKTSQCSFL